MRLAIDAAQLGMWHYSADGDLMQWDARCAQTLGLVASAERGFGGLLQRVEPNDRSNLAAALREAMDPAGSGVLLQECRTVGSDGAVRWIVMRGQAFFEAGACDRMLGVLQDITAQRRLDEALRQSNRDLEERVAQRTRERDRIWNLSLELMDVCRVDGTLVSVNPAWERLLGWTAHELQGSNMLDLVHPDDRATTQAELQRLAQGQHTIGFDNRYRHRDGGYRWVRWTASVDGGLLYGIGRDVTDERAAADHLAATNRELKTQIEERSRVEDTLQQMQRLEAVGQLTSGVAHDFNNLLTVVLSNISLIQRLQMQQPAPPDERIQARLESMRKASLRGAKLTAQLLAFSRRQRLETQQVDFNDVVLGMRDLLQTTLGGSVSLSTELTPGLWPALVDPTQLELIILNLAINARDAMEVGGSLTVRTANRVQHHKPTRPEEPEPGEYVVLTVTDTGSGMEDAVLAKAFEPFFTTKEVGKGSGLGLAQVYGFAKQSGGGVRIETRLGEGTAVHVYMPRALPSDAPAAAEPAVAAAKQSATSGSGHTLLVVDDDEAVREVTVATLQTHGYHVIEAPSGAAALRLVAHRADVDLVLADFAMPGMNGAELAHALKAARPGLPVLFMTGFADLAALKDVHEDYVLQKPLPEGELAKRLQRLLAPA
jgi:PAS domain S-box-containing protein